MHSTAPKEEEDRRLDPADRSLLSVGDVLVSSTSTSVMGKAHFRVSRSDELR